MRRAVGPAQHGQQVLDVRGFQEFQPAVLDEGDVAPGQFDLEEVAVLGAAKQHGLALQGNARLALGQDLFGDEVGLLAFVQHAHQSRPLAAVAAVRHQGLGVLVNAVGQQRVGGVEHRLQRPVVHIEGDARGRRRILLCEAQDVFDRRAAKGVDRLRVVADHEHPGAVGTQASHDAGLQPIAVLVFVNQDVVEALAHGAGLRGVVQGRFPPQQQVIEIQHTVGLLAGDIAPEQLGQ